MVSLKTHKTENIYLVKNQIRTIKTLRLNLILTPIILDITMFSDVEMDHSDLEKLIQVFILNID